MIKHSEEFRRESVRIALSSGLPRARVAADLGTLGKWLADYRPSDLLSSPQADLAREIGRLRLENRILTEERDILKKPVLSLSKGLPSSSRVWASEVRVCGDIFQIAEGGTDLAAEMVNAATS